jgi:hypothetical protein
VGCLAALRQQEQRCVPVVNALTICTVADQCRHGSITLELVGGAYAVGTLVTGGYQPHALILDSLPKDRLAYPRV